MSKGTFKNLLLLALPASGKSEVRKYLASMDAETMKNDFHIGETIQLDDFPYVHMMRRIDEELKKLDEKSVFFHSPDKPFMEPKTWGVLIHLLNEDYADLMAKRKIKPKSAAELLLKRLDSARNKFGLNPLFFKQDKPNLSEEKWKNFIKNLEEESQDILDKRHKEYPANFENKTVIIEFARGGADKASMPIPFGYEYNLKLLSAEILEKAAVFYIWVTPEESRRKNVERGDPNDPGSILKHSVPIDVMLNDYGCDDVDYLLKISDRPGYIKINTSQKTYYLPLCKFDNRVDKTSFIRNEVWKDEQKQALHNALKETAQELYAKFSDNKTYSQLQ